MRQQFELPAFAGQVESAHAGDPARRVRREVVRRLRQQVAAGAYDPPVDELVDRIVALVLCRQASRRSSLGD